MREQENAPTGAGAHNTGADSAVRVRTFRADDVNAVLDLLARSWTRDAVTAAWFTHYVLLDPRFDANGLLIAEVDGSPIGTAYAVAADEAGQGVEAGSGWIPFLVVAPESRHGGVGSLLLASAMAYLRDRGMASVTMSAYPPAYVIPGIDYDSAADGGNDALSMLVAAGFAVIEEPVGMRLDLPAPATEGGAEARASAIARGFSFRSAGDGDIPELLVFAATIGADWGDVIRESVLRHGDTGRFQLAFAPDGAVAGFATFGSYEGDVTRFGPFGVDATHRGASLGRILLDQTLSAMHSRGATEAWFLWTDLAGAAGRLYTRAGFTPFRRFAILRRTLA